MKKYDTLIQKYLPNVKVNEVNEHTHWYDNDIIEVNKEYILRIRKVEDTLPVDTEIDLLNILSQDVSIDIPTPLPQSWKDCLVYKRLPWSLLSPMIMNTAPLEQKNKRSIQLSQFFTELHDKTLTQSIKT